MWIGLAYALQATVDPVALCAQADAIAFVEVTSAETVWTQDDDGHLLTRTWASVLRVMDGRLRSDTLEVLSLGGTLDGLVERVEDHAALRNDHRYVLLLTEDKGAWRVTGGEFGAWPVPHGLDPVLPEGCHVAR